MARTVEVKIVGDSSRLSSAFRSADSAASSFGSKTSRLFKTLGPLAIGAGVAVAGGLFAVLKTGFAELSEGQAALSTTETLIKNLGSATKLTSADIEGYASSIQNATGLQDDMIISAENVLLKFEPLASDTGVFKRATELAADMAVAMGVDMPQAAQQLGRALADPEAAMGKLARMGIVLNEEQEKTIKKMVEMGDTAGATEYLLGLLEDRFSGTAAAAGETLPGKIEILKRKFEEFAEGLATKVLPYAERFVDWVGQLMDGDYSGAFKGLTDAVKELGSTIGDLLGKVDFSKVGGALGDAFGRLVSSIDWGSVAKSAVGFFWSAISGAFSAGADMGGNIGYDIGYKLGEHVAEGLRAVVGFVATAADEVMAAVQTALEAGGKLPDWLGGGQFRDWAAEVGEARDALKNWVDGLGNAGEEAATFGEELTESNAQMKLAESYAIAAARALTETEGSFSVASRGASELVTQVGTLAGLPPPQIKALINDSEFMGKLAAMVQRIKEMPGSKEFRAQALVAAAQELIQKYTGVVKAVPDKSTTQVTAPGAVDSKSKIEDVTAAARTADRQRPNVSVSTSGTANATTSLNAVAAAGRSIERYIQVVVDVIADAMPSNAAGTSFWRGGVTMVGEEGPELVALPRGSAIYPAGRTRQMLADTGNVAAGGWAPGGGDTFIFNFPNYHGDKRELADEIRREFVKVGRSNVSALGGYA